MKSKSVRILAAVLVVAVALAIFTRGSDSDSRFTIVGTLELRSYDAVDNYCKSSGALGTIKRGTSVRVTNEAGTIIGSGLLQKGVDDGGNLCTYAFRVENVPTAGFYGFRVANSAIQTYSFQEMAANSWKATIELRDDIGD